MIVDVYFAWLLLSVAGLTWLLTALLVRFAVPLGLVDVANARSAHSGQRPRGGGLAILLATSPGMLVLVWLQALGWVQLLPWLCAWPVALAGLYDDWRTLAPRWRLLVQSLLALALTALLLPLSAIPLGPWLIDPGPLAWLLVPLAVVWLVNLYNFMDGIDSLALLQFVFVGLSVLWLVEQNGSLRLPLLIVLAAAIGFLPWNLPPARIFMGDVGSNLLGFGLAVIALICLQQALLNLWSLLLLMGVFIADTAVTLSRRWLRGASLTEGHSCHAYQHLSRRLRSHASVTAGVLVVNLFWLLPLAWLARTYPEYGVLLAISGIVPLMLLAARLGAGKPPAVAR